MAVGTLIDGGVETLGQMVAMSDEELQAIRRIGPVGMAAIRKEATPVARAKQTLNLTGTTDNPGRRAACQPVGAVAGLPRPGRDGPGLPGRLVGRAIPASAIG